MVKLDILGRTVEVTFAELKNDEGAWLGEYDDEQRLIRIDHGADYWSTLLHEVMHAAFRRINFQPGDVAEEILADVIAAVICENFNLEHRGAADGNGSGDRGHALPRDATGLH